MVACTARVPYPLGIQGKAQVSVAEASASFSAPVHQLADIRDVSKKSKGDNDKLVLRHDLAAVRNGVNASVNNWLLKRHGVHLVGALEASDQEEALKQARQQGADLLLAVDVSGYGHIKRRWIALLFGSGVIEGITQGVAATDVSGNLAVGIGVGVEEVASEGLTWIGGSWFWGKYFAPVTLEGRMWRVRDGKLVWHDIVFADNSDDIWKLLTGKKLPKKQQALAKSLAKAEKDLFTDLGRYVRKQVQIHHWR